MDRSVMEGDPHTVIEGLIIGAIAIGSHKGYIYVRDEYPLAVKNLQRAIDAARASGLLGENILGSGLGLSVVRKIVTLYQGEISVETQENVGTTFRVVLDCDPTVNTAADTGSLAFLGGR